jgi:uncharacterized protein (TIGR02217 family)
MAYLRLVAKAFAEIAAEAGLRVRLQVGEPWWWVRPDGGICLYDAAAVAAFAPVAIGDVRGDLTEAQRSTLDSAGAVLAASTAALVAAVKADHPDMESLLLVYLPTVLEGGEARRANLPAGWQSPAFDVLQLEDYEWVTRGAFGAGARGAAEAAGRLGYPPQDQHYFAGFVLRPEERAQWHRIARAVEAGRARGAAEVFVWALPQVLRDGFTWFDPSAGSGQDFGEDDVDSFDDVRFPIALGREASVEAGFSTSVVTSAGGAEQRNSDWADARLRFDAGPGVRGEEELRTLLDFFRARRGAAVGFRFEDPFDHDGEDQLLGLGDGLRTEFALVKRYGGQVRRITRPVAGTVRLWIGGEERVTGWALGGVGLVQLDSAPAGGVEVRASFAFDVPVRFAEDRLSLSRATFAAGEIPSVPLVEIREA